MFSLCCMVSCRCIGFFFETCIKSEKCIKTLFRGTRALYQFSQPFPEQINAKHSNQKSRRTALHAFVIKQ